MVPDLRWVVAVDVEEVLDVPPGNIEELGFNAPVSTS